MQRLRKLLRRVGVIAAAISIALLTMIPAAFAAPDGADGNSLGGNSLGGNSLGGNSLGGNSLGGNSLGDLLAP